MRFNTLRDLKCDIYIDKVQLTCPQAGKQTRRIEVSLILILREERGL